MKIFVFIFFLVISADVARAQWSKLTDSIGIAYANNDTLIGELDGWNLGGVISTNGGKSWEYRIIRQGDSLHRLGLFTIVPSEPTIWYAAIDSGSASNDYFFQTSFYKTTNSGESWILQQDSLVMSFYTVIPSLTVSWSNANVFYSVDGGHDLQDEYNIYLKRSDDAGKTWQLIDWVGNGPISYPSISFAQDRKDSNTIYWYVTVTINESVFEQFFVSHDKGRTASELFPPGNDGGDGTLYANPGVAGDIFYLGGGSLSSQIWHSSNYGVSWDTATGMAIAALGYKSYIRDFIVSKNNPGLQFATTDTNTAGKDTGGAIVLVKYPGSATWEQIPGSDSIIGFPGSLIWDDATQTLYVNTFIYSTGKESIWKWRLPTAVHESNSPEPTEFTLGQNYPNPVQSITTIPIYMKTGGDIELHIYNLQGKEVKRVQEGALSPGAHTIALDLHELESGTYIYTIKNRSQKQSKLLTIIH